MLGVIGDVVQDIVVWLQEEVRPATDTHSEITMTRGGSAANVAAFAGKRYPTRFIGCVGGDLAGLAVTQELESHGVDVRMQVADTTTGMIVLLVDHEGERTMFPSRGASGLLQPINGESLEDLELLHITGYSLQGDPTASSVIDAARRVKERGGSLSIDVSSTGMIDLYGIDAFKDLIVGLEPDFVSANKDEARYLGLVYEDRPGTLLRSLGGTVLLARAGKDPTRIFENGELVATVPVTPAQDVRDMTGAGDAFNAGFLTFWLRERNLVQACEAGHTLARRVLSSPGATEPQDSMSAQDAV